MTWGVLSSLSERGHATESESREARQAGCCSAIRPKPASRSPRETTATQHRPPGALAPQERPRVRTYRLLGWFLGPEQGLPAHNPRGRGDHPAVSAPSPTTPWLCLCQHHLVPIPRVPWPPACLLGEAVTVTPLPTSRPPPPMAAWIPPLAPPKLPSQVTRPPALPAQPARIQQAWPKPHEGRACWHTCRLPWLNAEHQDHSPKAPASSPPCTGPPGQPQGGLLAEVAGPGAGQAAEPRGPHGPSVGSISRLCPQFS